MSRQISAAALEAVLSQETDKLFLTTVRISHASLDADLRFVNDRAQLIRSDGTYLPAAFEFRLPDDLEDNIPRGEIVLDNTDRQIVEAVRSLQTAPEIEVNIVLADQPNTPEIGPMQFTLKQFNYNAQTIRGRLGYDEDFLSQAVPAYTFNPRTAPGLF